MKDMGEARYMLGMEIVRNYAKRLLGICLDTYIKRVLESFQMHYSKHVVTLVEKGLNLSLDQCPITHDKKEWMEDVLYANAVGSLMYNVLCTAPDIFFVVGLVSHCQSNLRPIDRQTVKRITHYLRGITDLVICCQGGDLKLWWYWDTNWGGD